MHVSLIENQWIDIEIFFLCYDQNICVSIKNNLVMDSICVNPYSNK